MTDHDMNSAQRVRRIALCVLSFYILPLIFVGVLALVLRKNTNDWNPLAFLMIILFFGIFDSVVTRYSKFLWQSFWQPPIKRRRNFIPAATQAAILAELPELSGITLLSGGGPVRVLKGKVLLLNSKFLGAIRPGARLRFPVLFALAHEARHIAVQTSRVLTIFRWTKTAYVAAAGAIYIGLLANVATVFDDPYRIALTISLVVAPYVAATLNVVLDAATNALDWYLEIDADSFALNRCRALGWTTEVPDVKAHSPSLLSDEHPPLYLRAANAEGVSVQRMIGATLAVGWIAAVTPLMLILLFTWAQTETPDFINICLAILYATVTMSAIAVILIAARPTSDGPLRSLQTAAIRVFLRIYITTNRLLGWVMLGCAVVFSIKIILDWQQGIQPDLWLVIPVSAFIAVTAIYMKASDVSLGAKWVIVAAICDACRLWIMALLLRASGVLPFFDDLSGLGKAMQEHPDFMAGEVVRIWNEESGWLLSAALASGLGTTAIAFIVLRTKSMVTAKQTTAS